MGPNRVGIPLTLFGFKKDFHFFGLIQPMADGLKFFLKEDFTPAHVRKAFYWLAPALTVVPALITVCVVPFGSPISLFGHTEKLVIADLDIGPLFVFSVASLSSMASRSRAGPRIRSSRSSAASARQRR